MYNSEIITLLRIFMLKGSRSSSNSPEIHSSYIRKFNSFYEETEKNLTIIYYGRAKSCNDQLQPVKLIKNLSLRYFEQSLEQIKMMGHMKDVNKDKLS